MARRGKRRIKLGDYVSLLGRSFSFLLYLTVALVLIGFGTIHIVAGFLPELVSDGPLLPAAIGRALSEATDADPGARGDYYNFLIGVPLAAAGSAVAAIVAASARKVANRQRVVQEMGLVDRKISDRTQDFLELVNAFDDIYEQGTLLYDDFERCIEDCNRHGVHILSVLTGYAGPHATYKTEGPKVEALRKVWPARLEPPIEQIVRQVELIFDTYQKLTFDSFWARAIDMQDEVTKEDLFALEKLCRETTGEAPPASGWSPRPLAREMRKWAKRCTTERAMRAYLFVPERQPLEFVGAMIKQSTPDGLSPGEAVDRGWEAQDTTPVDIVNRGASKLYTLYRALPSQEALEQTVYELFPLLDSYECRAYFATLPDKRRITHDGFLKAMDEAFEAPKRLICRQEMTMEGIYLRPKRHTELLGRGERRKGQVMEGLKRTGRKIRPKLPWSRHTASAGALGRSGDDPPAPSLASGPSRPLIRPAAEIDLMLGAGMVPRERPALRRRRA